MTGESDSEVEEYAVGHNTTLKLDNWTVFTVDSEAAHLAFQLRQKRHNLVLRRLRAPSKPRLQVQFFISLLSNGDLDVFLGNLF